MARTDSGLSSTTGQNRFSPRINPMWWPFKRLCHSLKTSLRTIPQSCQPKPAKKVAKRYTLESGKKLALKSLFKKFK